MTPGTDYDTHGAFLRAWSDSDWAGDAKDKKSQSSLKIEVNGCPLYPASRKQKARGHSSGEAEYHVTASAASEAMLIREVLLFTGLDVRTELLLVSAATRGRIQAPECWDHTSFVNESSLAAAVGETRSGHGRSVCIRREPAQTWRQSHCLPVDCVS